MEELTCSQKDHKYCHEQSKCASCQYADQEAIKDHSSCCTYGSKLEFNSIGICLTHKDINI